MSRPIFILLKLKLQGAIFRHVAYDFLALAPPFLRFSCLFVREEKIWRYKFVSSDFFNSSFDYWSKFLNSSFDINLGFKFLFLLGVFAYSRKLGFRVSFPLPPLLFLLHLVLFARFFDSISSVRKLFIKMWNHPTFSWTRSLRPKLLILDLRKFVHLRVI